MFTILSYQVISYISYICISYTNRTNQDCYYYNISPNLFYSYLSLMSYFPTNHKHNYKIVLILLVCNIFNLSPFIKILGDQVLSTILFHCSCSLTIVLYQSYSDIPFVRIKRVIEGLLRTTDPSPFLRILLLNRFLLELDEVMKQFLMNLNKCHRSKILNHYSPSKLFLT